MNKKIFSDSKKVFSFTYTQLTKNKSFKFMAYIVPILIAGIIILIYALAANDENKPNKITNVYLVNSLGEGVPFQYLSPVLAQVPEQFSKTVVHSKTYATIEEAIKQVEDETSVVIDIYKDKEDEEKIKLQFIFPEESDVKKSEAKELMNYVQAALIQQRVIENGITVEKYILMKSTGDYHVMSQDDTEHTLAYELSKMLIPMLFVLILYMLILMHGQSLCKVLIAEKISKLIELMLTKISPMAMVAGKLMAVLAISLTQFFAWVIGAVAGLFAGHFLALEINSEFNDLLYEAIKMLMGEKIGSTASIIFFVISTIVAIAFAFCLAASFTANAEKAEDLAKSYAPFQMIVVIAFMAAYLLPLMAEGNSTLEVALVFIPMCSVFTLPMKFLFPGNLSFGTLLLALAVLLITLIVIIYITGKVHKNAVYKKGIKKFQWLRKKRAN